MRVNLRHRSHSLIDSKRATLVLERGIIVLDLVLQPVVVRYSLRRRI